MSFRSLPWRRFSLETRWSPTEITREMGALLSGEACEGHGEIAWRGSHGRDGFWLTAYASIGANALAVSGRVEPQSDGSRIVIRVRLPWSSMFFALVGIPLLSLLSLGVSVLALLRRESLVCFVWVVPLALWGGIVRSFSREACRVEEFLRKFFPPPAAPSLGPFR